MNILAPDKWYCDLDSCEFNGQAYVMLGRIQNLDQLYLKWSYDPVPKKDPKQEKKRQEGNIKAMKNLKIDKYALAEAEKISKLALNNEENKTKDPWLSKKCIKIVSLNIQGSLQSRLSDLQRDETIYRVSDIICLQETGTSPSTLPLNGYSCFRAGEGNHKGVAVYVKEDMARGIKKKPESIGDDFYQGLKLTFGPFDLITVYRSNNQPAASRQDFVKAMEKEIDAHRLTILCGDFNFDRKVENDLTRMLTSKKFKQTVQQPTTYRGYCIDHVYHNIPIAVKKVNHKLHYPYYSDHEAVCVMIENA